MLKTLRKSSSLAGIGLVLGSVGCQTTPRHGPSISFDQAPPAVRSAFLAYYSPDTAVQNIFRDAKGGQDYYTFTYKDKDGQTHEVELNEGGDQVDQH